MELTNVSAFVSWCTLSHLITGCWKKTLFHERGGSGYRTFLGLDLNSHLLRRRHVYVVLLSSLGLSVCISLVGCHARE